MAAYKKKEENMNLSDMLKPNLVLSGNSMKEIINNIFYCITVFKLFCYATCVCRLAVRKFKKS